MTIPTYIVMMEKLYEVPEMIELIYCADGNRQYAEIAIRHGFHYGAQLPNTIYYPPYFADQNWRAPDFDNYMAALEKHRPALATVLDWERPEQLSEVLCWAETAAHFVSEAIIIIPKVMGGIEELPRVINGIPVRLGYSVPTRYAGTQLPLWEFAGWPVHLLGGSPQKQYELARYMDVRSADGNYIAKLSRNNQFFVCGGSNRQAQNRWWPRLNESVYGTVKNAPSFTFELSCVNLWAMWVGCTATIRYAVEDDLPAIKRIANQYKTELGFVMLPSLRRGIVQRELYVAEYGRRIVGFCNWHKRRDGWHTVYEIAVEKSRQGEHIGRALLEAVPLPRRLKCPTDNSRANEFYEHLGGRIVALTPGKQRPLHNWEFGMG